MSEPEQEEPERAEKKPETLAPVSAENRGKLSQLLDLLQAANAERSKYDTGMDAEAKGKYVSALRKFREQVNEQLRARGFDEMTAAKMDDLLSLSARMLETMRQYDERAPMAETQAEPA
jgi:hypothetical protein